MSGIVLGECGSLGHVQSWDGNQEVREKESRQEGMSHTRVSLGLGVTGWLYWPVGFCRAQVSCQQLVTPSGRPSTHVNLAGCIYQD
jgi:hypothetical protein